MAAKKKMKMKTKTKPKAKKIVSKPKAKKAPAKKTAAKKTVAKKVVAKKKAPAKKVKKSTASIKADRARVSTDAHEVNYVAKKHGVDASVVTNAVAKVGHQRVDVEAAVTDFKKRSAAADKSLVSQEDHEIQYLADKYELDNETVRDVVSEHGPSRADVEAELAKHVA